MSDEALKKREELIEIYCAISDHGNIRKTGEAMFDAGYAFNKQLLEETQKEIEILNKCRQADKIEYNRIRDEFFFAKAQLAEALVENEKLKTTLPTFIKLDPTTEQITRENAFVECTAMLQRQLAELKHENYDIRCQRQSKINELDELKFNKDNCEKRNAELTATLKLAEEAFAKISHHLSDIEHTNLRYTEVGKDRVDLCKIMPPIECIRAELATIKERMKL